MKSTKLTSIYKEEKETKKRINKEENYVQKRREQRN